MYKYNLNAKDFFKTINDRPHKEFLYFICIKCKSLIIQIAASIKTALDAFLNVGPYVTIEA